MKAWWDRHAARAADGELPNLFVERQADDLVFSWDAMPSQHQYYTIGNGRDEAAVNFAVPVLRELVQDRLGRASTLSPAERSRLLVAVEAGSDQGYEALTRFRPGVDRPWLERHGLAGRDAERFATIGVSRIPLVGLLRTSQGSGITTVDLERVLAVLTASKPDSYRKLRDAARGANATVDALEPWQSGYDLARHVRGYMNLGADGGIDVESVAAGLGVGVQDLVLSDESLLGVCMGSPAYAPTVIINTACKDANGPSGRQVTVAHELCHLLFDRSHMVNLIRFEGGGADTDRMFEMRANAFAIELLVPRAVLIGTDGSIVGDEEITRISLERRVSSLAIQRHLQNLTNQLSQG